MSSDHLTSETFHHSQSPVRSRVRSTGAAHRPKAKPNPPRARGERRSPSGGHATPRPTDVERRDEKRKTENEKYKKKAQPKWPKPNEASAKRPREEISYQCIYIINDRKDKKIFAVTHAPHRYGDRAHSSTAGAHSHTSRLMRARTKLQTPRTGARACGHGNGNATACRTPRAAAHCTLAERGRAVRRGRRRAHTRRDDGEGAQLTAHYVSE